MSADKNNKAPALLSTEAWQKAQTQTQPNQQAKLKQHVDDTATMKLAVRQKEKKRKCCKSLKTHNL